MSSGEPDTQPVPHFTHEIIFHVEGDFDLERLLLDQDRLQTFREMGALAAVTHRTVPREHQDSAIFIVCSALRSSNQNAEAIFETTALALFLWLRDNNLDDPIILNVAHADGSPKLPGQSPRQPGRTRFAHALLASLAQDTDPETFDFSA
jgi:hypothetical protein